MAQERVERRLAAVLAGDVAGYSRLMGADEEGTLKRLNAHRREFLEPKIAEHRGRIVKRTGDGILIEFASAVDAGRCAIEIQRGMDERNKLASPDRQIQLRIGIHVGDIIIEEGDIFGDGVNVAARLEGIAEPGGICISEDAYRQVRDKLDNAFEDAGEQQLKNIARAIRVYHLKFNESGAPQPPPALALPEKPSIAVLPFQNMSGDPEQEYFADGMVEEIITGLSRIKWLFVIARNSTFTYKGRSTDVKQIGRELGVRYVLEGSVRRSTDRVRITCQLIGSTSGGHIWAERYDRRFDDIFALQDEIAQSVAGAIEPTLWLAEVARVKRKRPDSLDAYDLVLRAQPDVYSQMPSQVIKALPLLDRAIELDPSYALAHAYAAMCHHSIYLRTGLKEESRTASVHHARIALLHGQDDATALTFAAFSIGLEGRDPAAAQIAFETAIAISPSSAFTYMLGSAFLSWGGKSELAIEWDERALRLSPFDPWRFAAYLSLARAHFHRGRYDESALAARKAVQSNSGFTMCYVQLAAALVKLGSLEQARVAAARALDLQPAFRCSEQFSGVGCEVTLAQSLTEALRAVDLPE